MSYRQELIGALRLIAAVLEENALVPVPYFGCVIQRCESLEQMIAIGRAYGGRWDKKADGTDFELTRTFGGDLRMYLMLAREEVCTRVVVGTKEVAEKVIEAQAARVIPAHTEEIVEWHCPPSLAGLVKQEKAKQLAGPVEGEYLLSDEEVPF